MEIEKEDEKSVDSFQPEMDLVKEEEDEENRLSQKDRLAQILSKIKKPDTTENVESPESNQPQVLRSNPNILRAVQKKDQTEVSKIPEPFDPKFKLNERYFYQNINANEWSTINDFIEKFIAEDMNENDLEEFFDSHPNISKGNVIRLQSTIENIFSQNQNLEKYKILINFIIKKYFKPKPVICECYFFPNPSNEQRVVNMFRTCKKTLDLAIFTFTRDSIAQAILEAQQRGVKIRCIGDDGNSKVKGSDVRLLASVGIPCKTDNNLRFHMHNKMAIIDNSVVITGSFNWTSQAVNKNQDNILFIEDKDIASQYTDYYNKIWDSFNTVITKEEAKQYIENEKKAEEAKKANKKKKQKRKLLKKNLPKKKLLKKKLLKKKLQKKKPLKKKLLKMKLLKKKLQKKKLLKKKLLKRKLLKKKLQKKQIQKNRKVNQKLLLQKNQSLSQKIKKKQIIKKLIQRRNRRVLQQIRRKLQKKKKQIKSQKAKLKKRKNQQLQLKQKKVRVLQRLNQKLLRNKKKKKMKRGNLRQKSE